uniref:Uncharacterized protein n=1 Tax=Meloidogyne enterolobii TaxID=390850 RepID=A0A6V7Y2Q9_MELEN|nr:unnamed protein product [Meloidogyne enterolobii]
MFFSLKTTFKNYYFNIKLIIFLLIYSSNGYIDESYLNKRLIISGRNEGQQQQQISLSSSQIQNYYKSRSPFYGDAINNNSNAPSLYFTFIWHLIKENCI